MAGAQFFETAMGRRFFEGTVPALVREIRMLNSNLSKLVGVKASHEAGLLGREIMVLPSKDGETHQGAVLTPVGLNSEAAKQIAEDVLERLEAADREGERDPAYEEWTFSTLLEELERRGFKRLETFNGPTWDRRGA